MNFRQEYFDILAGFFEKYSNRHFEQVPNELALSYCNC